MARTLGKAVAVSVASIADAAPDRSMATSSAYLPPPQILKKLVRRQKEAGGGETVTMSLNTYYRLLETAMKGLFDEAAYLAKFPDVAAAVKSGVIHSALRHYVTNGYLEGRAALSCEVDDNWYRQTYPDVADAIRRGKVRDSKHHFEDFGFFEGRVPSRAYLGPAAEWRDLEKHHAMNK